MSLQPYQQRVVEELDTLEVKIKGLALFIDGSDFKAVPRDERSRLKRQLRYMTGYRDVLKERIAFFLSQENPAGSTTRLPDIEFADGVPTAGLPMIAPNVVAFADTGRAPTASGHRLECDVTFLGFLAANTGNGKEGHLVVQTRSTLANLPTGNFRGIGWIAGSLWQQGQPAPFGIGDFTRRACIEDWQNGQLPFPDWPFLKPASVTPRLKDGYSYHVVFECKPAPGGWMARLRFGNFNSGWIASDNNNIDEREQAIGFAALGRGRVRLANIKSTWYFTASDM